MVGGVQTQGTGVVICRMQAGGRRDRIAMVGYRTSEAGELIELGGFAPHINFHGDMKFGYRLSKSILGYLWGPKATGLGIKDTYIIGKEHRTSNYLGPHPEGQDPFNGLLWDESYT